MEKQRYPQPGDRVLAMQKIHYATGELTEGVVKDVLTKKRFHPRGHKVRLTSGIIARVQKFLDESQNSANPSSAATHRLTKEPPPADNYFQDPEALR